jgi:deoxyribodipyrimidine photo-lyase
MQPNPTREAGLQRLEEFLPRAGAGYASGRNHVPGVVSGLSPYVRHRLVTESEIAAAVLHRHSAEEAGKFLQEICWRTYWKGWLEMRPGVWSRYLEVLPGLREGTRSDPDFLRRLQSAEAGETGLECLDDWVRELRETGYLHNHVRMWFASIWIHTLRLPWQLGADFFMRHLLDGDPASNTLSWRWVCGLQTNGKVYLATAENIERYTDGRYAPHGLLAKEPPPMEEKFAMDPPLPLPQSNQHLRGEKTLLIITEEDLSPESWGIPKNDLAGVVILDMWEGSSDLAALPIAFKREALRETAIRLECCFELSVVLLHGNTMAMAEGMHRHLQESGARSLTLMNPSVGPVASHIDPALSLLAKQGIITRRLRRAWDDAFWPHATHGFFKFRERIPATLSLPGIL